MNQQCRVLEKLAYTPGSDLLRRLDVLQAQDRAASATIRERLNTVSVGIGEMIAAKAGTGEIPEAAAVRLLKQLNTDMKATLYR
jgi:hypothetical protein